MFENILGHENLIQSLRQDIQSGCLPQALLFYGPKYSGKLSTALELARVLTCEKNAGQWNCSCPSCWKQRSLVHPNVLMLGTHDYFHEIISAKEVLLQHPRPASRFLFIRAVRKQLKGFNPLLWEGEETRLKSHQGNIQEVEDSLDVIESLDLETASKNIKELVNLVVEKCEKLCRFFKSLHTPINHIRRAVYWAHISSIGMAKVIIMNGIDHLQTGSSNSLLKILEEPPQNVYLILISEKKGPILNTLLSRLRPYHFLQRNKEAELQVLEKIFKANTEDYDNLREYFLTWRNVNPSELRKTAQSFIELCAQNPDNDATFFEEVIDLIDASNMKSHFVIFLEEILKILEDINKNDSREVFSIDMLESWTREIHNMLYQFQSLNINSQNLMEKFFLKMSAL